MKYCPIMSFQKEYVSEICCRRESCAWWDDRTEQCVIKTLAQKAPPTYTNSITPPSAVYTDSAISPLGGDR